MGMDVLYDDGRVRVEIWSEEEKGHLLYLDDSQYGLQRGILEEISKNDYESSLRILNTVNNTIFLDAERKDVDKGHIVSALISARVRELEEIVSNSIYSHRPSKAPSQYDAPLKPVKGQADSKKRA